MVQILKIGVFALLTGVSGAQVLAPANGGTGTHTAPTSTQILIGQGGGTYLAKTVSGDATITAAGVVVNGGIEGVPFCSGYTPTNGQFVQYTTGGTPNPCYAAATGGGGGITQLTGDGTAGPGSGSQAFTLANTAVTPGSYTCSNVTFDSKGRATSAANGSCGGGGGGNSVCPTASSLGFSLSGSDETSTLNTQLAAAQTAGTAFCMAIDAGKILTLNSAEITLPNNGGGTPTQIPIRITGALANANGLWAAPPAGSSTINLSFNATDAKIVTLGLGTFELDHVYLKDTGSDCAPFILTTNTTINVHDVVFSGTATGTSACNDAIILGGTSQIVGGGVTNAFRGYNTTIKSNFFDKIRRGVYFREAANAVTVKDNTWSSTSGATTSEGAIQIGFSGATQVQSNIFSGNLFETTNYPYTYNIWGQNNEIFGDTFWDASGGTTTFLFHFQSGAVGNIAYISMDASIPQAKMTDNQQPAGSNAVMDELWQTGVGLASIQNRLCNFASGSGTAQVCNTGIPFVPGTGSVILFKTATFNTGAGFTLNVNGLGVKNVAKYTAGSETTTLIAGDIIVGINPMWYDGTNWVLGSPGNGAGASGPTPNSLTMNSSGSGASSGSTFNGASAVTLSYNTLGAAPTVSPAFTGTPDASGATQFKLPVAASAASLANGEFIYDTTNKNWHGWVNGADTIFLPLAAGFTSGHCAQPTLSSGSWSLVDVGGACGVSGGGSSFSAITSGVNSTATMTVDSGASIIRTGTGIIDASLINGAAPALVNITGSGQITATGCTQSAVSGGNCSISGSSTTAVTFSVIPSTYQGLRYVIWGQGSAQSNVQVTYNSDTAAHYVQQGSFQTSTSAPTSDNAASASNCPVAGLTTGIVSHIISDVPFYANTSFGKSSTTESGNIASLSTISSNFHFMTTCAWNSTAAITSITFTLATGHYVAGTEFVLYGVN